MVKQKNLNLKGLFSLLLIISIVLLSIPAQVLAADVMTVGKIYSGFELKSEKGIAELKSTVLIYEHVKTGARLLYMKNDDDNKVFSITFRTPPSDNTGVNHIIEHSVLDGSLNYPTKSPFFDLGKRSLNTYANAATYYDRTTFPVASRNEKDFFNIMGIYLDAVFYPNMLKDQRIFMQEGGHYELDAAGSNLTYNGVVYNEMKGATSQPGNILSNKIKESLFPDNTYKWASGGEPADMLKLTWEKAKETYNKYYHPSNSYIYLYGNLDINKALEFIDRSYLSKFDKKAIDSSIPSHKAFTGLKEMIAEYPVSADTQTNGKTYLALSFVIDQVTNKEADLAFSCLGDLLVNHPGAPLREALLANGIGTNAYAQFNDYMRQPVFSIIVENAEESQKEKFEKIVRQTLENIVKDGFDKEYLQSLIHAFELRIRASKSDTYRGLAYNDYVMYGWLYDSDPTMYLSVDSEIAKIGNSSSDKYLEGMINKYILQNAYSSMVVLKPAKDLQAKKDAAEKAYLDSYKAKLTTEGLSKLTKETAEFKKWQSEPDSLEAVAKLPSLNISDIESKAEEIPLVVKQEKGLKVLSHPIYTNKIAYVNLYFDANTVSQDKVPYLFLLSDLLGKMDTQKYDHSKLTTQINGSMGGMYLSPSAYTPYNDYDKFVPQFSVSFFTLYQDLPKAMEITSEVLNTSKFNDSTSIKQIIKQIRQDRESYMLSNPLGVEMGRLASYLSNAGKYNELGNIEYYNFICDLDKNFDSKFAEIKKNLEEVQGAIFNKNGLIASVTGDESDYPLFKDSFGTFVDTLKSTEQKQQNYKFTGSVKSEGFMAPVQVQSVAAGYSYKQLGHQYSGKMQVLKNILDNEYLTKQVRIIGGAYGGAAILNDTGNMGFVSIRDPRLTETLDVFKKAGEFLKNLKLDDRAMTDYIISTIGTMDAPMSPDSKGKLSDFNYLRGKTQQDIQKERNEILSTKLEDIRNYAEMVSGIMKQDYYIVIGNENKIKENEKLFEKIMNALKQ
ncbi:MAG: insulinase family protein [Clostridia bacterium]|nr:insulinase family protein [Clostridia bacterium]